MGALITWDGPAVKRAGDLRFGQNFKKFGDPFEGVGRVKDLGDGACMIVGLHGRMGRDIGEVRQCHDEILELCNAEGFSRARMQRMDKIGTLHWWEYDLTTRPFRRRRL